MTEVEFKRKLAKLLLAHAEKYLDKSTREILTLVTTVEDERAVYWQPHPVALRNDTVRVITGAARSLKDPDLFEDFHATFSASGNVSAEAYADIADLLNVAMVVAEKAQKLVQRYNAGVRKQSDVEQ